MIYVPSKFYICMVVCLIIMLYLVLLWKMRHLLSRFIFFLKGECSMVYIKYLDYVSFVCLNVPGEGPHAPSLLICACCAWIFKNSSFGILRWLLMKKMSDKEIVKYKINQNDFEGRKLQIRRLVDNNVSWNCDWQVYVVRWDPAFASLFSLEIGFIRFPGSF